MLTAKEEDYRGASGDQASHCESLRRIGEVCRTATSAGDAEAVVIRVTFGGTEFLRPCRVDDDVLKRLEALIPDAPLHLPVQLRLIRACLEVFPVIPIVLVFETAFFASLLLRECLYGLDTETQSSMNPRRFGYHGILHEAAVNDTLRRMRESFPRTPPRLLSIYLGRRPEVAAILGNHPRMVTSGVTPLEGLPGERTCGEIDPSIVLTLANLWKWGPEQVNHLLTQESGLFGMVGRLVDLKEALTSQAEDCKLAGELMRYRLLLACGAGIAALGGLDGIVFSGRYAALGEVLGPWLSARLVFPKAIPPGHPVPWHCFQESEYRVIADQAAAAVLATQPQLLGVG
jgi:acetate kinase